MFFTVYFRWMPFLFLLARLDLHGGERRLDVLFPLGVMGDVRAASGQRLSHRLHHGAAQPVPARQHEKRTKQRKRENKQGPRKRHKAIKVSAQKNIYEKKGKKHQRTCACAGHRGHPLARAVTPSTTAESVARGPRLGPRAWALSGSRRGPFLCSWAVLCARESVAVGLVARSSLTQ